MTREDLRGIVEGITDEQLKRILDINSSDIGKTKGKLEDLKLQLESANTKLAQQNEKLAELEERQCEAEKMKNRIEELQKVIDESHEQAEKERVKTLMESRFASAAGTAEFLNDFTRNGVLAEFMTAVNAEENAGKSDEEIFCGIVENRENIFVPEGGIPAVVAATGGFGGQITDGDVREIMGLPPLA